MYVQIYRPSFFQLTVSSRSLVILLTSGKLHTYCNCYSVVHMFAGNHEPSENARKGTLHWLHFHIECKVPYICTPTRIDLTVYLLNLLACKTRAHIMCTYVLSFFHLRWVRAALCLRQKLCNIHYPVPRLSSSL